MKNDLQRARAVFDHVGLIFDILDTAAHQLSGGEQQRVGITLLALRRSPLMLRGESTSALEDQNSRRFTALLRDRCFVFYLPHKVIQMTRFIQRPIMLEGF